MVKETDPPCGIVPDRIVDPSPNVIPSANEISYVRTYVVRRNERGQRQCGRAGTEVSDRTGVRCTDCRLANYESVNGDAERIVRQEAVIAHCDAARNILTDAGLRIYLRVPVVNFSIRRIFNMQVRTSHTPSAVGERHNIARTN